MLVGLISLWTRPRWCSRPSAPERATARRRNLPTLDRKSTRLNSSHLGISYAVFCLKKKKQLLPDDLEWGSRRSSDSSRLDSGDRATGLLLYELCTWETEWGFVYLSPTLSSTRRLCQ